MIALQCLLVVLTAAGGNGNVVDDVGDVTHFDLFGFPFADPVVWESEGEDKNKSLATAGFRKSNPEKYDGGEQKVVQQQTEETTYEAMTVEEFKKNTLSDMYAQDSEATYVPAVVTEQKRDSNPDNCKKKRDLNAEVNRWEHRDKINPEDPDGCGSPICAVIDQRPKRFSSMCNFTTYLKENAMTRQFIHIQKGDCADGIEKKGHDYPWGGVPNSCDACSSSMGCNLKVCVAAVYNEEGKKYDSGYKKEEKKDESGYKKEEKKDESGYKKEEEKDESGYEKEEEKDESGYTQEEEKDESSYNKRKKREYKEEGKKDKTGFALAVTYENVCELMKRIGGRVDIISVHISLGECGPLLVPNNCLYTEWFDIDEPCHEGDTESASQNMAFTSTLPLTGRFRMCPSVRRSGDPQFQTVEGTDIPRSQRVNRDLKNHRIVCKNSEQTAKPDPPFWWFALKIKCRDYKIRHCCKCLYGCYPPANKLEIQVDLPESETIFSECQWKSFVSNECPQEDTWDAEDREGGWRFDISC